MENPVQSWKAGPGEVMTLEKQQKAGDVAAPDAFSASKNLPCRPWVAKQARNSITELVIEISKA